MGGGEGVGVVRVRFNLCPDHVVLEIFGPAFAKSDESGVELLGGWGSQKVPILLECIVENYTGGMIGSNSESSLYEVDGEGVGLDGGGWGKRRV